MDDTPYIHDGADASLRKTVSLLNKIEAKTGSATITGPVTVTNEVEIKNDANNPLPVSDNNGSLTVDGTVELGATSLAALENISVTFPATQNVNVTNAGLSVSVSNLPATQPVSGSVSVSNFPATQPVSLATAPTTPVTGTFWQATQPVSIASAPVTPVTDNGGSLTVDGSVSVSNFPATQPVSGTFWQTTQPVSLASAPVTPVTDNGGSLTVDGTVTVNDMTSGNAKTKIVDSVGADVSYITAGTAGTPSASVLSVQGISGGTSLPISGTVDTGLTQPLTDTQLRAAVVPVSLASVPSHAVTQATAANLNATVVGSGSFTAAQATASSLKAQAQILNSAGSLVTYAETGTYGSPSVDVISVQNPQGVAATITTFTSTTASTSLIAAGSTRKAFTVYNSGAGDLYISPTAVCTTTNFQIKLSSGDYWECPASQVLLSHTGVFASAGTAYVTAIT